MTADTPSLPAAQECWGLYDASGNLMDADCDKDYLRVLWNMDGGDLSRFAGWTIRRVRVEPVTEDL